MKQKILANVPTGMDTVVKSRSKKEQVEAQSCKCKGKLECTGNMTKRSIPLYKPSGHNTAAQFVHKLHDQQVVQNNVNTN